jgi:hypothetical protein
MGALCHRAGMRPALTHRKPLSRVPALGDPGQGTARPRAVPAFQTLWRGTWDNWTGQSFFASR